MPAMTSASELTVTFQLEYEYLTVSVCNQVEKQKPKFELIEACACLECFARVFAIRPILTEGVQSWQLLQCFSPVGI